jgi:hypothetical protein
MHAQKTLVSGACWAPESVAKGKASKMIEHTGCKALEFPVGDSIKALKAFLADLPTGPVQENRRVIEMLSPFWVSLVGSSEASMATYKLNRAENLHWEPPLLKFTIERHGAASLGSSRAELQEWTINLDEQTASYTLLGYRQLRPNAPRLKVEPIVASIIEAIRSGKSLDNGAIIRDCDDQIRIRQGILTQTMGQKPRLLAADDAFVRNWFAKWRCWVMSWLPRTLCSNLRDLARSR